MYTYMYMHNCVPMTRFLEAAISNRYLDTWHLCQVVIAEPIQIKQFSPYQTEPIPSQNDFAISLDSLNNPPPSQNLTIREPLRLSLSLPNDYPSLM